MNTYTVKDIAEMLNTNPETVRRWIRSGRLKADQSSRKEGNSVSEQELYTFLKSTSKYEDIAVRMAAESPDLAKNTLADCGVTVGDDRKIESDEIRSAMDSNIAEALEKIREKQSLIDELTQEIRITKKMIDDYQYMMDHADEMSETIQMSVLRDEDLE